MTFTVDILFATGRLRDQCTDSRSALKALGKVRANALQKRLDDLAAATTLAQMRELPGRCEELREDREGQLSVRLDKNYRLIFEPADEPVPAKDDGGLDWTRVRRVRVLEVLDYHG